MDLSPYNKQNFPQIWPKYAISSETMRLNIKVSIWHVIWCKLVLIWLIFSWIYKQKMEYLLQMIKMVDKNHIYVPIYNVNPFYICLLVLLLLKIHICSIPILFGSSSYSLILNAVDLSSIELRWLSLAQLNPSLFSIFIPETAIIQFYLVMNIPGDMAFLLHKF